MESVLLPLTALLLGIVGLVWGADKFVAGSASFARTMGISPLVIGLTIVSVGTSAPEIIVSLDAALRGSGELAVGNALGSNLANMGLVLGITLLIAPIPVYRDLLTQESLALLGVTALAGLFLFDGVLGRLEGIALVILAAPLLWLAVKYKRSQPTPDSAEEIASYPLRTALIWFVIGLAALLISAEITVWGAIAIASSLGISQLVIGLTILAVGTSLPELAASILSAVRGHHDIALGNIIGSNLFNLLLVMGIAGAIAPIELVEQVFSRDYLAMAAVTVILVILIAVALRKNHLKGMLSKYAGLILLSSYCLYYYILWLSVFASQA